ncbi:hypothetical protein D3C81_1003060 [compost metagenome]
MDPSSEYLLLDPQPAIRIPKASMEIIAMIKNSPVCVLAGIKSLAHGITANPVKTATKIITGAILKRILSAKEGVINSF